MVDTEPPAIKPREGTTAIDDKMSFEPERLSYESAVLAAREVAARAACCVRGKAVVIIGTDLLADLANLKACYLIVDDLAQVYESLRSHASERVEFFSAELAKNGIAAIAVAAVPSLAAVATAANLALGLVSLLRQDVAYSGRTTRVDDLAFQIALASAIKEREAKRTYVPGLLALSSRPGATQIQQRLARVQSARAAVWNVVGPLISNLMMLEAQLTDAVNDKDQQRVDALSAQLAAYRRAMEPLTSPLDRADRRLDDLMAQWNTTDAATGMTALGKLVRAEAVEGLAEVYVHAQVVASGGHYKTIRHLFRTMFLGDGLTFRGGVVVRWAILFADGALQQGGVFSISQQG